MIQEAIYSILSNDAAVTALISNRIYHLTISQNSPAPCISYSINEGPEDETFDGQGDFRQDDLQIDCWASTYTEALQLATVIKAVLKNYSGVVAGTNIQRITLDTAVSVFEDDVDLYRTSQSYSINI